MTQVTIGSMTFDVLKMPPREQLHTLRRVSPLLAGFGPGVVALLDDELPKDQVMAELVGSIGPLTAALGGLPDEQLDYVMDSCLLRVNRLDPTDNAWHPIYVRQPRGAIRMYSDIDLRIELELVAAVIKENLTGFFAPPSGATAPPLGSPLQGPAAQTS